MKKITLLVAIYTFCVSFAYAVDPKRADMSCEQLSQKYQFNPEGELRFADFKGSCTGVYVIKGELYALSKAVIRSKTGGKIRLFIPATKHTFEVTPDPSGFVYFGGKKMRVRDLQAGEKIGVYLSIDKFAEERVDEVAFATDDDSSEEAIIIPMIEVEDAPASN